MKKVLSFIFCIFVVMELSSQGNGGVDVSVVAGENGVTSFHAVKSGVGVRSLVINLFKVSNYNVKPFYIDTITVSRITLICKPVNEFMDGDLRFRSYDALGIVSPQADSNMVCNLPVMAGREPVKCSVIKSPSGPILHFYLTGSEKVCAIQPGVVIDRELMAPDSQAPGTVSLIIQHSNGTWAYYANLKKESVILNIGDKVDKRALIGEVDTAERFNGSLFVYINYPVLVEESQHEGIKKLAYRSLNPLFETGKGVVRIDVEGTYSPE